MYNKFFSPVTFAYKTDLMLKIRKLNVKLKREPKNFNL